MLKTIREEIEERERNILSPYATLSSNSKGRLKKEEQCDIRTDFQRDRDRIIHSKAFRRLRYKTQVFLAPKGDHYRTRLTHTLEVSQIARVISRALALNEDLTEAIALGHDLGHTPFGHAGETVLNRLLKNGFRHNEQSLKVVDEIEKDGKGLNLTIEVRDGILKHSKGKGPITDKDNLPVTKEGQVVRIADLIAYLSHDMDDALRARVIKESSIPKDIIKFLGRKHSTRINSMVRNIIEYAKNNDYEIRFSSEIFEIVISLRDFMYKNVYEADIVHKEFYKAEKMLEQLFNFFRENQDLFLQVSEYKRIKSIDDEIASFLSGMTDRYAIYLYEKFFLPKPWEIL
ncbi:MAG: deoxyguanosinetriphosphate triphosphohydrolase [Proteobacteria bacterium]|nr:deoxyguanosinetriphosphate triphosphohydrolase [Pseudomonadota bacterium]